jgi:chaperonin GroEL
MQLPYLHLLITTEAVVYEKKEKEAPAPPMPGGMGGMDGMY